MKNVIKKSEAIKPKKPMKNKFFQLSLEHNAKLKEIAFRLNIDEVAWLRKKIEEEHAGLGK